MVASPPRDAAAFPHDFNHFRHRVHRAYPSIVLCHITSTAITVEASLGKRFARAQCCVRGGTSS
jgi:hypothetical protein